MVPVPRYSAREILGTAGINLVPVKPLGTDGINQCGRQCAE